MKGRMALGYLAVVGIFLLATYFGSEATTAIAERIPMQRNHVIVIDAGHGGEDGGAVSVTGEKESNINLAIALRLRDLMHLMGYQTKMIRDRDVSVYVSGDTLASKKVSDLRQRVKTVNETENAVFISIHQNTFHEEKYAGAHVFYAEDESAKALAESMQAAFGATINPGSVRSAKKAEGIYLMQHIQKPGILVECGFHQYSPKYLP